MQGAPVMMGKSVTVHCDWMSYVVLMFRLTSCCNCLLEVQMTGSRWWLVGFLHAGQQTERVG
eukprot:1708168-Amphidinium_carterae.3